MDRSLDAIFEAGTRGPRRGDPLGAEGYGFTEAGPPTRSDSRPKSDYDIITVATRLSAVPTPLIEPLQRQFHFVSLADPPSSAWPYSPGVLMFIGMVPDKGSGQVSSRLRNDVDAAS